MLEGNVHVALCLVTERADGGVILMPQFYLDRTVSFLLEKHFSISILSLVFHLLLFYPVMMPSLFLRMLNFVLLIFRLLLAGSRVVLVLGAVMLLTGAMFCFTMVLTVDA